MIGCRICQGTPRRGTKCMFCGLRLDKLKKKGERRTPEEQAAEERQSFKEKCHEEEMEYLRTTRRKLITFRMTSTGCESLDQLIIKMIGDWRDEL